MLLLFIIYIPLILIFSGIDICSGRVCKQHRNSGYEYFCCENFERKQGKCVECEKGYLSMGFGKPCKQCKRNMYGFRCAESCTCKHNQRCDHVIGCVNVSIASTHSNDTENLYTGDSSMLHVISTTTDFTDNKGSNVQTVYIYTISVAVFTVAVILGLVLMVHYKRNREVKRRNQTSKVRKYNKKNIIHNLEETDPEIHIDLAAWEIRLRNSFVNRSKIDMIQYSFRVELVFYLVIICHL